MAERRVPTVADAQRQVWVRCIIGWLLIGLSLTFLVLVLVKHLYFNFLIQAGEGPARARESALTRLAHPGPAVAGDPALAADASLTDNPTLGLCLCHLRRCGRDGGRWAPAPVSL
jgi:hypothetical protein